MPQRLMCCERPYDCGDLEAVSGNGLQAKAYPLKMPWRYHCGNSHLNDGGWNLMKPIMTSAASYSGIAMHIDYLAIFGQLRRNSDL